MFLTMIYLWLSQYVALDEGDIQMLKTYVSNRFQ